MKAKQVLNILKARYKKILSELSHNIIYPKMEINIDYETSDWAFNIT